MKQLNRLFLATFLLTALVAAPAKAVGPSILAFQVGALGTMPDAGNLSLAPQAAWIPSISGGSIGLRGELGAAWLPNGAGGRFFAFNYEGYLVLSLSPVTDLELGGGLATWMDNGGTHPLVSADLAISLPGVIKRLFFGYSRFFLPGVYVHEFKAGLGFSL